VLCHYDVVPYGFRGRVSVTNGACINPFPRTTQDCPSCIFCFGPIAKDNRMPLRLLRIALVTGALRDCPNAEGCERKMEIERDFVRRRCQSRLSIYQPFQFTRGWSPKAIRDLFGISLIGLSALAMAWSQLALYQGATLFLNLFLNT